jgi:glucokinase-like ROK family protein
MPLRTASRTGDQALVREINLSLIMNHLLSNSTLSRASLAEVTGLNKSTVSSLVQELIDRQFVREVGLSSSGVGRPSMLLEINPQAGYIVSCELGVDFLSIICANFGADVVWRYHEDTRDLTSQHAIIDHMLALLIEAVDAGQRTCANCGPLLGLAVGAPGLADRATGTLLFAPNLKWENVALRDILGAAFPNIPVFVENEANMAALGEYFFGAAKGYREVLYLSAGVGLGGAVVLDGAIFEGTTGFASEFGHMTMDPNGELCNCGNRGCWETQVSQRALFRLIHAAIERGKSTLLTEATGGNLSRLTVPLVVDAARRNDRVAQAALNRVGRSLGVGVASLVNVFNPDLVVFGGIMSLAGEFLLPIIRRELAARALKWSLEVTEVILAQQGSDACVMGGIAMLYQTILSQPGNR